jgi:hypothetical protein
VFEGGQAAEAIVSSAACAFERGLGLRCLDADSRGHLAKFGLGLQVESRTLQGAEMETETDPMGPDLQHPPLLVIEPRRLRTS